MNENIKGAALLRKYREYDIKSFQYYHQLIDEMEDFVYRIHDDYDLCFDMFLNDSGKYIIFHIHNPERFKFSDKFIKEFCREYKLTFEGITREVHTDYEGYEQEQLYTYVFEIIKGGC